MSNSAKGPVTKAQQDPEEILKGLKATLDEAEWRWLAPHAARGAVIVVSSELVLLNAAVKVALDQKEQVQDWIDRGLFSRPTLEQLERWHRAPDAKFLSVIVEPFVLIQENCRSETIIQS